jgi:cell division protein FtsI/penicillin-binding protein 2
MLLRDARQKKIDISERMVAPKNGYDVVLTIDEVIQYIAEQELEKAVKTFHAKGASIVVMDPHTGAILALANRPTYDLNDYASSSKDDHRNRAVCDLFEPGSVFKIVTASAALQEKKVSEENKFYCENGAYKFLSHALHDHRPHGWLTLRNDRPIIQHRDPRSRSSWAKTLYKYVRLDSVKDGWISREISGSCRVSGQISIVTILMGQEVGVTALQLADAARHR